MIEGKIAKNNPESPLQQDAGLYLFFIEKSFQRFGTDCIDNCLHGVLFVRLTEDTDTGKWTIIDNTGPKT